MKISSSKEACFKDLAKDVFSKFKKVRKLHSLLMGEHQLYSKDGVKYILKELSSDKQFFTTRPNGPSHYHKYCPPNSSSAFYIFPIIGVQMSTVISHHHTLKSNLTNTNNLNNTAQSQAAKEYENLMIKYGGSFEKVLLHVLKFLVKLTLISRGEDDLLNNYVSRDSSFTVGGSQRKLNFNNNLKDFDKKTIPSLPIIIDCIRVQNGQLFYCYDTWMDSQQGIVLEDIRELENFFFSQQQLTKIQIKYQERFVSKKQNQLSNQKINYNSCKQSQILDSYVFTSQENISLYSALYKVFLSILYLGSSQLNLRLYEWGEFKISQQNLQKRIHHFKLRFNSPKQKLADIIEKFLLTQNTNYQQIKISEILNIFNSDERQSQTRSSICKSDIKSSGLKAPQRVTLTKKKNKQNSFIQDQNIVPDSRFSITSCSNSKISDLKNKIMIKNNSYSKLNESSINCLESNFRNSQFRPLRERKVNNNLYDSHQNFLLIENQIQKQLPTSKAKNSFRKKKLHQKILQQFTILSGLNQRNLSLMRLLQLNCYQHINEFQQKALQYVQKLVVSQKWQFRQYKDGSSYFGQLSLEYSEQQNMNMNTSNQKQSHFKRQGFGVYLFPFADIYIGKWKDNQINDFGIYLFKTGQTYIGGLKDGKKQGFGTFWYSLNKKYEGFWKNNKKIGLGTVQFLSLQQQNVKVKFLADFDSLKSDREIEGIFTCYVESKKMWSQEGYLDDFDSQLFGFKSLNQKNSSGTKLQRFSLLKKCSAKKYGQINYDDGSKYAGQIHNKNKNGFGIQENDGYRYQGEFIDNKREGKGKITVEGKFSIQGQWKDGIMVKYTRT